MRAAYEVASSEVDIVTLVVTVVVSVGWRISQCRESTAERVRSPIFVSLNFGKHASRSRLGQQSAGLRLPLRDTRDDGDRPSR